MTEPTSEDVRIVGRYALHQEIAAGGMATVHLGRLLGPAGFSRTVAVKRLHAQYAKDPEFVSMFLDEARLAARIRHPNVVSTLDIVALEGEIFIVMDYVEGESLARLIRTARSRGERIPTKIALSVMTNVLYGLHGAHEARGERGEPLGIVHRDVSPQNILVDTQGTARMVDFGVAKAVGRLQTTRDGQLKGKLAYMAPEQLRGHKVDARTDVFAASIVLWELLTGQRLFQGDNEAATFGKILECDVAAPSAAGAETTPEIDAIVTKGLAGKPEQRWDSALDMAEALEHAARDRPTQRELGRWVRTLAEETLSRRAQAVRELESHSAVNELVGSPDGSDVRASFPGIAPVPEPPPPVVPASRASAATLTEPMRDAPDEAPAETHDSVAPTRVSGDSAALAEASGSGKIAPPAVSDDVSDDEPTRLADPRLPAEAPVTPGVAPPPPPPALLPIEEPSGSSQVSSIALARAKTAPPPPHVKQRNVLVLGVAVALSAVALLGLVVLVVALGSRTKEEPTGAGVGPAATGLPAPAPRPSAVVETKAPEPTPSATPAPPPPPKPEKPVATAKSKPEPPAKPVATGATKPKPAGAPNCNPPYTLDKDGTRIPKLECL